MKRSSAAAFLKFSAFSAGATIALSLFALIVLAAAVYDVLFRFRLVPDRDLRVLRADDVRTFQVHPMPAACCCRACWWLSSN